MLVLYILLAILILAALKYLYLVIKRLVFVSKLKASDIESIRFTRNILQTVIFPDGRPDIELRRAGKVYSIMLLSSPFCNTVYHFRDDGSLDILLDTMFLQFYFRRTPLFERSFKLRTCKLEFGCDDRALSFVPVTKARYAVYTDRVMKINSVGVGDDVFGGRIYSAKYFTDKVMAG